MIFFVQEMIKRARATQKEITRDEERVRSNSSTDLQQASTHHHVRKNTQKWSEGLISAAKDIGAGAKMLVDSANHLVTSGDAGGESSKNGGAKFEELIAASREIAQCSAQVSLSNVELRNVSK